MSVGPWVNSDLLLLSAYEFSGPLPSCRMNDLRTAIVALVAVVVGFAGAWLVFGARTADLIEENKVLRGQRGHLIQQTENDSPTDQAHLLVGTWSTTVEKSRLGQIDLVFDLQDDGDVVWRSVSDAKSTTIAQGKWKVLDDGIHFAVTIVDDRSSDKGKSRTTVAQIKELGKSCLSVVVDGTYWSFHRLSA